MLLDDGLWKGRGTAYKYTRRYGWCSKKYLMKKAIRKGQQKAAVDQVTKPKVIEDAILRSLTNGLPPLR